MTGLLRLFSLLVALGLATGAAATDVTVVGLFPNKALVQINGGSLRTLSVGQKTDEGVTLVSVDRETATFTVDGQRVTLRMGQARIARTEPNAATTILADSSGMFRTDGSINGRPIRFTVDTGATYIALSEGDARRLAIDYAKGVPVLMRTANGNVPGHRLKLDTVSLGNVTLYQIDAVVIEGDRIPYPLLGQSFLSRLNMKREGDIMTLTKRF